jgi:glycosyltransferase involved in cell wall biosynthesis
MRVLHVVASAERRGAELFAADLIPVLNQAGVSQRVVALRQGTAPSVEYGGPTAVLRSRRRRLPGVRFDRQIGRQLRAIVNEWKPDVIQVHGGEALKHVVLSQRNGTPVVYRRIGSAPRPMTRGMSRIVHGQLMRRASHVVAVAEALKHEAIEFFAVPEDKVTVIPNAVDPGRLRPQVSRPAVREALGIPSGASVVLSLGALTWEKDPLAHLDVSKLVLADRLDAMHLFVGDGPLRPALERAVRERGLGGRVLVLGSRRDVPDLLAATDVMLLASRVEGLPGCLIEAGMAGIPVVAYALAGVPEVVVDGVTGHLVSPGDIRALARAVVRLLGDEDARKEMPVVARERCLRLFDIRTVSPRYVELYEEVAP